MCLVKMIKRLFFAYLALIVLTVTAYAVSRVYTTPRDPETLYTTYLGSIRSFDPVSIADVISSDIAGHFYECLYNYKYGGRTDELIPQLAAAMPEVSADGLTYTFTIRPGIHFFDPQKQIWDDGVGPEVTAHDIVYSWKRMADFHSAAPSYSTVLQDNVVGLDEFRAYTEKTDEGKVDYDRPVEGLVAKDAHTLVVKLSRPVPNFVQLTAYLGLAATSRESVEKLAAKGQSLRERPIGTGPYGVIDYKPEQRIVLVANPAYRGRPDINPAEGAKLSATERLPHIQRIQFDYMPESLPPWYLFLQGRYDAMGIPKETFAQAITPERTLRPDFAARGINLKIDEDPGLYFLQFNMTDAVVGKNKALREAIALSIDRENFIRIYLNGRGIAGTGILPPDAPLYDKDYVGPFNRFDLAAAKLKVAEAKIAAGGKLPTLKLQMQDSDTDQRQYAEFLCAGFRAAGLDVKPEYNTYARYLEKLDAKEYQIAYGGWYPDYPDEKTYLRLFDATLAKPPGSNTTGYVNAVYQEKLERALVMPPSKERDALYLELAKIVDTDLPITPVFFPLRYRLRYDWVGNAKPPVFTQGFYAHWTLDTEKRRKALLGR